MKKSFLSVVVTTIFLSVLSLLGVSSAQATQVATVTWANFGTGANTSPVTFTLQFTGISTDLLELNFNGVKFNPSSFVSDQTNAISSNACVVGGFATIGVTSTGSALTGNCAATNVVANVNPTAGFAVGDTTILDNTINITFPVGSLEVTDQNNASVDVDASRNGGSTQNASINLSSLLPTPTPTPTPEPSLPNTGADLSTGLLAGAGTILLGIVVLSTTKRRLQNKSK